MEPIIHNEIKSFNGYHAASIKNVIAFMLSRMVCIAVSCLFFLKLTLWKRLDKDQTFLNSIISLIKDMGYHTISESVVFSAIDFLAIIKYVIKYQPKEISDQELISSISMALASATNPTGMLVTLTPLLIRSFLNSKAPILDSKNVNNVSTTLQGSNSMNILGESLLQIFLSQMKSVECIETLTMLLENVSQDLDMRKYLSHKICEKFFSNSLEMDLCWTSPSLRQDLNIIMRFLDNLILENYKETSYDQICKNILQELINKIESNKVPENNLLLKSLLAMRLYNKSVKLNPDPTVLELFLQLVFLTTQFCNAEYFSDIYLILLERMLEETQTLKDMLQLDKAVSDSKLQSRFDRALSFIASTLNGKSFYRFSYSAYTSLVDLCVSNALVNQEFCEKLVLLFTKILDEKNNERTHVNVVQCNIMYLALCTIAIQLPIEKIKYELFTQTFWTHVLKNVNEDITFTLLTKLRTEKTDAKHFANFVELLKHKLNQKLSITFLQDLVRTIKKLPPQQSIYDVSQTRLKYQLLNRF